MITALDHVTIAVNDLDRSSSDYARLLAREASWTSEEGGVRHVWFQLKNVALDLCAPSATGSGSEGPGDALRRRLLDVGEGLWSMAFGVDDLMADQALLVRRGLAASSPATLSSTHSDGRTRCWTECTLDEEAAGGVRLKCVSPDHGGVGRSPSPFTDDVWSSVDALDHVVIQTAQPDRVLGVYGAKLGLDLRLDRTNPSWGARQLFFRCGQTVVEVVHPLDARSAPVQDRLSGLAWRVGGAQETHGRLVRQGFEVSEIRQGRKPGSHVFTIRKGVIGAPCLMLQQAEPPGRL